MADELLSGPKKKKQLTLKDEFEFPYDTKDAELPRDVHNEFNDFGHICKSKSPKSQFPCAAGYAHSEPHVFRNSAEDDRIYAVWRDKY